MKLKTPSEVKAEFNRKGVSVASWARENGFSGSMVYDILNGRRKRCARGQCHRIAVKLGLKDGEIVQ